MKKLNCWIWQLKISPDNTESELAKMQANRESLLAEQIVIYFSLFGKYESIK